MTQTKSPLQSLTILSAAGSLLTSLLGAAGIAIDPALAGQAVDGFSQLLSAALAAAAIYGRLRASTRIARAT